MPVETEHEESMESIMPERADRAINQVTDEHIRSAFMAVRTEYFRELRHIEALGGELTVSLKEHTLQFANEVQIRDDFQKRVTHLLENLDTKMDVHLEHDIVRFDNKADKETFEYSMASIDRLMWKVMWSGLGVLGSVVLSLLALIGYLIVHHGLTGLG